MSARIPANSVCLWRTIGLALALVASASLAAAAENASRDVAAARQALINAQPALAISLYTSALRSSQMSGLERARVLLNRGLAHEQLGHRPEALADFNAAIALRVLPREDLARALLDRGVTLDEMGKSDAAISDYSAALDLAPHFSAALNNRANAYRRRGALEKAKQDYQASLINGNATPEYPLYGLGQIAEAQGDRKAALNFYRQAFEANPKFTLVAERVAALSRSAATAPQGAKPAPAKSIAKAEPPADTQAGVRDPAARATTGPRLQLGAYRDEATAMNGWKRLVAATGDLLLGLEPEIVKAEIAGKGTYYRLRAGPLPKGRNANALCESLQEQGFPCMVVKG